MVTAARLGQIPVAAAIAEVVFSSEQLRARSPALALVLESPLSPPSSLHQAIATFEV